MKFLNVKSNCFTVANGTRQGGILSPYIFSIYVRGLVRNIVNYKVGCNIGRIFCIVLAYADNLVLLAPSWHALQELINVLHNESVLLDTAKKCCMVFSKRNKNVYIYIYHKQYLPCLKLGNAQLGGLNYVMSFKRLGHVIID